MNASLDPDLLFISDDNWNNPNKRDTFLGNLKDNLEYIDEYLKIRINWSDELEACLWNAPVKQPWHRDYKNQIIPIMYRRFYPNLEYKDISNVSACNVEPTMYFEFDDNISISFLKLMHKIIIESSDSYLSLGLHNSSNHNGQFTFFCCCCPNRIEPVLINKPNEWLNYINVDNYWPINRNDKGKFKKGINAFCFKEYQDIKFANEYEISNAFLDDLCRENTNRDNIIQKIVKRLRSNHNEARLDRNLRDEYIEQSQEYRFYVDYNTRIHYKIINNGKLLFLRYYPQGHHDDGL